MEDDLQPDLSAYQTAPIVKDPGARCVWCGEKRNADQGLIFLYDDEDEMHAGCKWSSEHGALRTQLDRTRDLDPAEVAALEQRMIDNNGEGIEPWWENR